MAACCVLEKRRFTSDYLERVTLRDGSVVTVRLLRPEDRQLLRAGFERLSPTSRYRRFFTPKTELTDAELSYLTEIDGEDHFAIGAVNDGSEMPEPLGVARFVRLRADPRVAEAAIAVIDPVQGKGLGKVLLHRLAQAALERSIERFRCTVLAENSAMQDLFRELDPDLSVTDLEPETRELDLSVRAVANPVPAHGLVHGLERLLSHAARGLVRILPKLSLHAGSNKN
jgi:RimJ/RimL family protein N-acetyltransferase